MGARRIKKRGAPFPQSPVPFVQGLVVSWPHPLACRDSGVREGTSIGRRRVYRFHTKLISGKNEVLPINIDSEEKKDCSLVTDNLWCASNSQFLKICFISTCLQCIKCTVILESRYIYLTNLDYFLFSFSHPSTFLLHL